jgi:acyl carrier protein phosphodiesterase
MNYLAHVFLSCQNEELLVGNILGDILKNRELKDLNEIYHKGVLLHRKIDSFTDNHPVHLQNLKHLYPSQGKYAPVVMDIYYDYFLGKNWENFSLEDQRSYTDHIYTILLKHIPFVPEKAKLTFQRMVDDDFLYSCQTYERLERTFSRVLKRVSFPSNMQNAVVDLLNLEDKIEPYFHEFFPDLRNEIQCSI